MGRGSNPHPPPSLSPTDSRMKEYHPHAWKFGVLINMSVTQVDSLWLHYRVSSFTPLACCYPALAPWCTPMALPPRSHVHGPRRRLPSLLAPLRFCISCSSCAPRARQLMARGTTSHRRTPRACSSDMLTCDHTVRRERARNDDASLTPPTLPPFPLSQTCA